MILGFGRLDDPALRIADTPLLLRPPRMEDFPAWEALRRESRAFLEPWEPVGPDGDLTRGGFRSRLRRYSREAASEEAFTFLIFRHADGRLLGGITVGNTRRGVAQMATIGYWMGEPFAGKGVMTHAVSLACRFAFAKLALHRVEAACLPENVRSMRLLEKSGFRKEGLARQYLRIAGSWRDHVLFARLVSDPPHAVERARV